MLSDLQEQFNLTILFISHDLAVVNHLCHRTMVMYLGKIVEIAPTDELFAKPLHPYVEVLLSAVPRPEAGFRFSEITMRGEVAAPSEQPIGCPFSPRCKYAAERCRNEAPELRHIGDTDSSHLVSCHFAESLNLSGIAQ